VAAIRITPFAGLLPSQDKAMIPANSAQVAENCRLTSGTLDAYKEPALAYNPAYGAYNPAAIGVKTIYRFDQNNPNDAQYWFTFSTDVDVVKGAVAGDTQERTYFTDGTYPKETDTATPAAGTPPYPSNSFHLGLPAPVNAISHTVTSGGGTTTAETRVYTYTYVSPWGEESPPAGPSAGISVIAGDTVNISNMSTGPTGAYNLSGAYKRIYRTSTGVSSTSYLLVADHVLLSATTFTDTVLSSALGEVLPTFNSALLPATAIGLTSLPNGIMAAFDGYDVYFSEAYKPYSWPSAYRQAVEYPIVGIGAFGTSLLVMTMGNPYLMTGSDPSSITVEKLAYPYSCVSKRSICKAFGDVIYASPDGLVSIGASGTKVLTDKLMTRLEWQAYNPSSMLCAVWDDRIFMFYDNGATQGCLCLDGNQGLVTSTVYATAAYTDPITGSLYLYTPATSTIVKWNAGSLLTYKWKSKSFQHPNYVNFAWGQVLANSYPVTLNVYANNSGTAVATKTVTSSAPFRLPSGFKSKYWELELVGSASVLEVMVAENLEEIKSV
jgi:hypothetical protein